MWVSLGSSCWGISVLPVPENLFLQFRKSPFIISSNMFSTLYSRFSLPRTSITQMLIYLMVSKRTLKLFSSFRICLSFRYFDLWFPLFCLPDHFKGGSSVSPSWLSVPSRAFFHFNYCIVQRAGENLQVKIPLRNEKFPRVICMTLKITRKYRAQHQINLAVWPWVRSKILATRCEELITGKDSNSGKDWGQEEKGTTEDEMVARHHRLIGHEFEQTPGDSEGQGILACCGPWGHRDGHDLATEQNKWPWAVWLLWALVSLCIRLCIIISTFQGLCPKQRKGNIRKCWTVSGTIKEKLFISTSATHHLCIICRHLRQVMKWVY